MHDQIPRQPPPRLNEFQLAALQHLDTLAEAIHSGDLTAICYVAVSSKGQLTVNYMGSNMPALFAGTHMQAKQLLEAMFNQPPASNLIRS